MPQPSLSLPVSVVAMVVPENIGPPFLALLPSALVVVFAAAALTMAYTLVLLGMGLALLPWLAPLMRVL